MNGLDVIIPCRGEGARLGACLSALLWDAEGLDLRVVVVLNGEAQEESRTVAQQYQARFAADGHELIIAHSRAGKPAALNRGDEFRRGGPIVYLDADVVPLPRLLHRLRRAVCDSPGPVVASPRLQLAHDRSLISNAFGRVWSELPLIREGVIGGGCYALNPAGRACWGLFPDIMGDDAFVCAVVGQDTHAPVMDAGILISLPEGFGSLVQMRSRWLRSKRDGHAAAKQVRLGITPERPPLAGARWTILRRPRIWPSLPLFATVDLAARTRMLVSGTSRQTGWAPTRAGNFDGPAQRPQVAVVIVTYNSEEHLDRCLAALSSQWADLHVIVFDNASSDASATIARGHRRAHVMQSERNLGFAAAVNRAVAAAPEAAQWVLLVNPDATPDPDAIDVLLAAALRYPNASAFGGRARNDGPTTPPSYLARPTLFGALLYAVGLSPGLGVPAKEASETARLACAVSGAFMLIQATWWRRIGGFDERFFLYGEDVDLCLRLEKAGRSTVYVSGAGYRHVGSASSASQAERQILGLSATLTLYARYAGLIAPLCQMFIRLGFLARLVLRSPRDPQAGIVLRSWRRWWTGYGPRESGL